ncbi:hypothetical protein BUALT_Bualt10G0051900 [Buddleja alternifolia]|uniref:Uncharacterized protein n=1 Tax=Buddleja alternifolia TaxID=168488 RepID=A0AAV6WXZ1_9LAMI|nr:hypothetical protein BUALT_Bualt10G0051900 [Buddleja alternifolia]
MAESTRSKEIAENLKKQEILLMEERAERLAADQHIINQLERMVSIQAGLQSSMATIENFQKGMQQQLQLLNEQMQQQIRGKSILGEGPSAPMERGSSSSQNRNNTHSTSETHGSNYTSFPKIEFPHFDGENPRPWILRSNRYFQVINTIPEEQKVTLASVYLEGKVELCDPDLIAGNFNKLHQTGSVADYLESGLKEEIRGAVMALKPIDFHQAVSLAKRQESTIDAIIKRANMSSRNFSQTKPRTTNMNTLRIKGAVKGQDVHIFIDSGSTHCFLDESTAHKLGCKLDYTTPMIVCVADGNKMKMMPRRLQSATKGTAKIKASRRESNGYCSAHSVMFEAEYEPVGKGHLAR